MFLTETYHRATPNVHSGHAYGLVTASISLAKKIHGELGRRQQPGHFVRISICIISASYDGTCRGKVGKRLSRDDGGTSCDVRYDSSNQWSAIDLFEEGIISVAGSSFLSISKGRLQDLPERLEFFNYLRCLVAAVVDNVSSTVDDIGID